MFLNVYGDKLLVKDSLFRESHTTFLCSNQYIEQRGSLEVDRAQPSTIKNEINFVLDVVDVTCFPLTLHIIRVI